MWYNWNSCALLLELKNSTATMENSLVDSQKVKHRITKYPSSSAPGGTARGTESRWSTRGLYWRHLFTAHPSADEWIRESVGCLGNGILHATKRNGISFKWCWGEEWSVHAHCSMDELYAGWRKPAVGAVGFHSHECLEWAESWDSKQIGSCWGAGRVSVGLGSDCLVGMEFAFRMRELWKGAVVMVSGDCD